MLLSGFLYEPRCYGVGELEVFDVTSNKYVLRTTPYDTAAIHDIVLVFDHHWHY